MNRTAARKACTPIDGKLTHQHRHEVWRAGTQLYYPTYDHKPTLRLSNVQQGFELMET